MLIRVTWHSHGKNFSSIGRYQTNLVSDFDHCPFLDLLLTFCGNTLVRLLFNQLHLFISIMVRVRTSAIKQT